MNTSLLDLDLAPSASLVVLPGSKHSASKPDSNPAGLFALLLMPFLWIWSLVVSIFISSSEPESITETRTDNTLSTPSTSQTTKAETKEESTSRPVRPK
ncbi:UBX domain-containing protein 4-like, partial [Saccoglossus kowalevskii]|uniref:UBX domain-containing protein 4-like n=1 Tax=Saccoglossus kowalevskii TaxID=10224 RepID=A0ABM0MBV3_SACKO